MNHQLGWVWFMRLQNLDVNRPLPLTRPTRKDGRCHPLMLAAPAYLPTVRMMALKAAKDQGRWSYPEP